MRLSVSRVGLYEQCPYRYKLKYLDGLIPYPDLRHDNALFLGTAVHRAMETDIETATSEYYAQYPIIGDEHINEAMKIEHVVTAMKALIPDGIYEFRVHLDEECSFLGFIDLLVPVGDGIYDMYDFKYSNNTERYMGAYQLHVYKWAYEKMTGNTIRDMYYVFAPKTAVRQKKNETLGEFRLRMMGVLKEKEVTTKQVEFDQTKVNGFFKLAKDMTCAKVFNKQESKLCDWCEYQRYCESEGNDDSEIDWYATLGR